MAKARWLGLWMLTGICAVAPSAGAERGVDSASGYSVTVPADWRRIDQETINQAAAGVLTPGNPVRLVAGYEPTSHSRPLEYPYLLVEESTYKGGERSSISEAELRSLVAAVLQGVKASDGACILSPPGFWFDGEMEVEGAGKVRDHAAGYFGKKRVVSVHVYYPAAEGGKWAPVAQEIVASFEIDAGQRLALHYDGGTDWEAWGRVTGELAGTLGVIVGVVWVWRGMKKGSGGGAQRR